MILSAQTLRRRLSDGLLTSWTTRTEHEGMTYGLGPCGYDVRVAEDLVIDCGGFVLASTMEHFNMPDDLVAQVCDKSTWARRGLQVQNTIIEPGWRGYLTLELTWVGDGYLSIRAGMPIAQIIFMKLDHPTSLPYSGKYQDQEAGPQPARGLTLTKDQLHQMKHGYHG